MQMITTLSLTVNIFWLLMIAGNTAVAAERTQFESHVWEEAFPHLNEENLANETALGLGQIGAAYFESWAAFMVQLNRVHQEHMAAIYGISLQQRLRSRRLPVRLVHRFKALPYVLLSDGALRLAVISGFRNPGISPTINVSSSVAKRLYRRAQDPSGGIVEETTSAQ